MSIFKMDYITDRLHSPTMDLKIKILEISLTCDKKVLCEFTVKCVLFMYLFCVVIKMRGY